MSMTDAEKDARESASIPLRLVHLDAVQQKVLAEWLAYLSKYPDCLKRPKPKGWEQKVDAMTEAEHDAYCESPARLYVYGERNHIDATRKYMALEKGDMFFITYDGLRREIDERIARRYVKKHPDSPGSKSLLKQLPEVVPVVEPVIEVEVKSAYVSRYDDADDEVYEDTKDEGYD